MFPEFSCRYPLGDRQHLVACKHRSASRERARYAHRCGVCHRKIPLSAAAWREGSDYVAHFCGFECYDRWLTTTATS